MQSVFHTILLAGNNPKEIADRYSLSTVAEKHLKMKRKDAGKMLKNHKKIIEGILSNKTLKLPESHVDYFKNLYLNLNEIDEFDYFLEQTKGCVYDEETGDAYTNENPEAKYKTYKIGENLHFAEPFILKNGNESYSAMKKDIDWSKMHMNDLKCKLCRRVWELIVEDKEPNDAKEVEIVKNWNARKQYFLNFVNCDEYVRHTCSFWHYGFATEKSFNEINFTISDKVWVSEYYKNFIEPLPEDTLLTIIEARSLD